MIRRYSDFTVYRRLLGMSRRYWPHIFGIFVLSLLATPLTLLAPVPLKIAVDSVIGSEPLPGWADSLLPDAAGTSDLTVLLFAALLLVAIQALTQLQSVSKALLGTYAGEKLVLRLRSRLFDHAQGLSLGYHDTKGTADSIYRIQSDATSIQLIAVDGVIPFVASAVTLASMLLVTAAIDPALALIALCVTPVLFALTWGYRRRLRERYRKVKGLESSALGVVQEALGSVRVVKAFGQEEREGQRFVVKAGEGTRARIKVALVDNSFSLLIGLVMAVGTALVLYVGVRQVKAGSLTLGDLLLVMAYLAALYAPLYTITRKVTSLQSAFASAERALTLLDEEPEVEERPDALPLGRSTGRVVFDRVSFSYDGRRRVLEDVSFEVSPGMRVGLAGHTGAGKTTLVNLLTRLYDPTAGTISLDGHDVRDYRLADLRGQFGIVLQEPVLFSTTIFENIAYGRPDASFEEVVAAAEAANAHEFVSALPDGYDTVLGDRGVTLSGGERQRVSLARAFLKDAPIRPSVPTSTELVGSSTSARRGGSWRRWSA